MTTKEVITSWAELFNSQDVVGLTSLYNEHSVSHQTPNIQIEGKENIKKMFEEEFSQFEITCYVENIFENGDWGMLEWKGDEDGILRGYSIFQVIDGKINLQIGYWDNMSFLNQLEKII
jgi:hypothetical protein